MIFHWTNSSDNVYIRHDSVDEARALFTASCSVRSPLRERCQFVIDEAPNLLPDALGYIIDRKLGDKCKDIYFHDGANVQLYLSKGYEPKVIPIPDYDLT